MTDSMFLDGGGDMGALMRATDWSRTPLGPISGWPQSLRTTVSTCLNSRFPILIWWGPQFVKLYNDAYREVIAGKHPHALGRAGREVWPEIWHIIGPMLDSVVMDGRATWSEDQFLPLERRGFPEECYFTFSYSPIRDETGGVGGVFCAVTETTRRVIGERRLRLLQALASDTAGTTVGDACVRATAVLAHDPADVTFAFVYLLDADGATLRRAAATSASLDHLAPADVGIGPHDDDCGWPLRHVLESGQTAVAGPPLPAARAFVTPLFGAHGSPIGVLVAGINSMLPIDDQYRGFAELIARELGGALAHAREIEAERARAQALAEIDRAKTAFFSNVSHEFRTPLTLILSPLQEALTSLDRVLAGSELESVYRNSLRLLKLVNTLLDFAAIEAGRTRVVFEPTDLAQLTVDLASTFRSAMTRAGLRFDVECPPLGMDVDVDRDAWEKIVLNLLSNALKFTFDGRIGVSLRRQGDRVELRVEDTGAGIPGPEIPRLFDRFHRVAGTRARTHEGSGIGLALTHELVKLHEGTIAVTSEASHGTTFTVSVPIRRSAAADLTRNPRPALAPAVAAQPYVAEAQRWLAVTTDSGHAETHATDTASAALPRVLVADDNADMREYVSRLLADRWTVASVGDGAAALEAMKARRPALVIADVMMPRVDGFELLRTLRANPSTRDIPVILLSARAGEEASLEGLTAGADDYIVKPFTARELRTRVQAQLLRAEIRAIQAAHDRQLADMFRHAPVAIALLRGADHVFDFANDECIALVGHRAVIGKTFAEALPELAGNVGALLTEVYRSGRAFVADSRGITINSGPAGGPEHRYLNVVVQPIQDQEGSVEAVAVIAVDVTDLARARHQAEAANSAKDQFLAVLGHELRNPLAPIIFAVEMLDRQGPADPALQRLRQTISRQAKQLLKLVDDLLDVGRIITGKLRLERSRVELSAIVRQAVETSTPLIDSRRHALNVRLPDAPVYLDADAGRLTQVLCNLLNNAAKYMQEGGEIDLSGAEEAGMATIRVRDRGIGIAPEMLERVFDRFVQAGATETTNRGLGIGLSVVKTIVELHGGTVSARSEGAGRGAEFTVYVPAAAPAALA